MTPYRDTNRDSGISHYDIGAGHIDVRFKGGGTYRYSRTDIGAKHLETLITLAEAGDGLHAYINKNRLVQKAGKKVR